MTNNLKTTIFVITCLIINVTRGHKKIETSGKYLMKYTPVTKDGCFNVLIKGPDAHISLSNAPQLMNPTVIVVIGGWDNKESAIEGQNDEKKFQIRNNTPDILNPYSYTRFWIKWNDSGDIRVGKHPETSPFLTYKIPQQHWSPINFVGVTSNENKVCSFIVLDDPICRHRID